MSGETSSGRPRHIAYQCPVCGMALSFVPSASHTEVACAVCGYPLWCWKSTRGTAVAFHVVAGRLPELPDVNRLGDSLVESGGITHVIVDLGELEFINSALVARLVDLHKRIRAWGGEVVLRGLSIMVRQVFTRTRLDSLFDITDTSEDASHPLCSRSKSHDD